MGFCTRFYLKRDLRSYKGTFIFTRQRTKTENRGPERSRARPRAPRDSAAAWRQQREVSGRRSCSLASRHSPGVTAQPGGGHEPVKSPVFFTVGATPPGSASKAYLPSPVTSLLRDEKMGASFHRAPRLQGQQGTRAARPLPTVTSWNALWARGERAVGAGRTGPGHRVRP